jgi:hypothetical protein
MKLRTLLTTLSVVMALSLTACPKKQDETTTTSPEPVEGSTTGNNEKSTEGPAEEMQEKVNKDPEPGAPAEAPADDTKK